MIAFDANLLSIALCPASGVAVDPVTKLQIERPTDRVNLLIEELDAHNEKILIPMPALAEFLVMVGSSGSQYLSEIHKLPRFEIGDFNEKAAIEVSMAIRKALDSLGKEKRDGVKATWAKVNFDRQIVAIAKAKGCSAIYSTDRDVRNLAAKMGLDCIHLADLPLPPDQSPVAQLTLKLLPPAETAEPVTPGRQILQIPVVEVIPPVPTANGAAGEEEAAPATAEVNKGQAHGKANFESTEVQSAIERNNNTTESTVPANAGPLSPEQMRKQ